MANPTIGATTPRIQYTATASQTVFTVPFEFLANADLAVYVNGTLKTLTTDYTLTGANTTGGGSLTFVTGRTAGEIVTILSDLDYSRNTNKYTKYGLLPAEVLEADFDALQVQAKQLALADQFAIRAPLTDTGSPSMTLPVVATRASKALGFDASGNPAISASSLADIDSAVNIVNTIGAAPAGDAANVSYTPAGTGAVSTNVQTKLREMVSVKDFGAKGDGTTDDTAAIQAAINSGYSLVFPAGTYKCANLTQSTNFQRFYAAGNVTLQKNANGPILTSSGSDVEFNGIGFRGESSTPSFTGHNFVSSGQNLRLINCGSRWAYARAVLATGNHVQIIGTCDLYQTTDSSATGYDIEIGVSGTATLYHELIGVYSSQNTGGIKLIDVGAHTIHGGQFGKLYIASGTSPAGVNGGKTIGARILGNVTVEISTAIFNANQFGTVTITFVAGTSGCSLDQSNSMATATVVNNGNGNSPIIKSTGTGSPSGIVLQYGHDAGNSTIRYSVDEIYIEDSSLALPNNKALRMANSSGTYFSAVALNASNNFTVGMDAGGFTNVSSGSGGVYQVVAGASVTQAGTGYFRPTTDNTANLGGTSNRWATVYAGTATINTSDAREKQQIRDVNVAERAVAVRVKGLLRAFKFNDAVETKGNGARIHFGVIAQDIANAFAAEGLNAEDYALFCFDQWEEQPEILGDDGVLISSYIPAGNRYGIRYEELLAFVLAAL
jgi:hypothetical protein